MTDPLEQLGIQAAAIDSENSQPSGGVDSAAQPTPEVDNAAMFAAFANVALGLLKAVRARVARGLPEIEREWTDASLKAVADAVPPVVNKYLAKLMPVVADYPEEGALAMACLPLLMGYVSAQGAAEKRISNDKAKDDEPAADE